MTDSIYDQLNAYGTVAKQRFVENFSGDALDTDRWATELYGSGTVAMSDSVDGGVILSSATSGDEAEIHFNDIKPFSNNASVMIWVSKINNILSIRGDAGFVENQSLSSSHSYVSGDTSSHPQWRLNTDDGTTPTATTIGLMDTSAHSWKLELGASNNIVYFDGVSTVTKTTNLPDAAQQPRFFCKARSSSTRTLNVIYCEAYNT